MTTPTKHSVQPCPPSSPQIFRRFARQISPVTWHILVPWNKRQPSVNDASGRHPRCGRLEQCDCTELPTVFLATMPVLRTTTRTEHPVRPDTSSFRGTSGSPLRTMRRTVIRAVGASTSAITQNFRLFPSHLSPGHDYARAPHDNPDGTSCATAPALFLSDFPTIRPTLIPCGPAHPRPVEQAAALRERCVEPSIRAAGASTSAITQNFRLFPWHLYPVTSRRIPAPHKQKRRVSRETRRPFPANCHNHQAVFFASPRYVSITRGFCASSAAGPSSANSPVSST